MGYCCGVDWGGSVHAVCVIDDADGHVVARFTIDHTAEGLAELRRRLDKIAPAATIPIAIERPSGLIVEALIQAGHPVVPIHPNVVKACRPRYRAAGGKSDPGDAYCSSTSCAPTAIASAGSPPAPTPSRRCALWSGPVTTWSPIVWRSPTACAACWRASGPELRSSSPTSPRRSR